MKRKSREEICKESEIVSLEISRKQFKEDLQLMEYMCSKKDLLTHSQENMKMSLGSQGQGKGLIKDKELE